MRNTANSLVGKGVGFESESRHNHVSKSPDTQPENSFLEGERADTQIGGMCGETRTREY